MIGHDVRPKPPADAEARARIVAARGRSLTVEAGAGTGKTTLLVERVVDRVRDGAALERLAIITFTRKAAAELHRRLRTAFASRAHERPFAEALARFEHAPIGTTDSFCRELLSDVALEAGAPPDFGIAEENAAQALRDRAWTRLLSRANPEHEQFARRLREAGIDLRALRDAAEAHLAHRDLALPEVAAPSLEPVIPPLRVALREALSLAPLCSVPSDALLSRLREADAILLEAESLGPSVGEAALLDRMRGTKFGRKNAGERKSWGGEEVKARVNAALGRLDEILDASVRNRGTALMAQALGWLAEFRNEYDAIKRERGVLDFRDLALLTRDALARDDRIRTRLAARFDEILLDEVQDSDPLQMEIAFLLAAATAHPEHPILSRLESGKLALIGDPKQSIYRFRRADIELYEKARERLCERGGDETIQVNFRSHPAILDFVNRLFRGWMEPAEGTSYQARAVDLLPGRAMPDDEEPRVHVILPDDSLRAELVKRRSLERENTALLEEVEVDAIARTILCILGRSGDPAWTVEDPRDGVMRPARPGDVAILVRRTDRGDALRETLEALRIPAVVAGGKRFYAREEIATLATLLRTIVNPSDEYLRFAALRSSAFGFDDDTLVLARLGAMPPDHPNAAALEEAHATLKRLTELARTTSVADVLPILVEELSLFTIFGSRVGGRARASSLAMLVDSASSLEDAGFDTLPDFVDWLSHQEGESRAEAPGELESHEEGVQILTMHKSKGLEFPIVILADLTKGGEGGGRSAIVIPRRSQGTIALRIGPKDAAVQTPEFELAQNEEEQRQAAESVRLLYVAMTRARDHLLISWMPKAPRSSSKRFLEEPPLVREVGAPAGEAPEPNRRVGVLRAGGLPSLPEASGFVPVDLERLRRVAKDAHPLPPPAAPIEVRGSRLIRASEAAPEDPTSVSLAADIEPAKLATGIPFSGKEFGTLVHKTLEILPLRAEGFLDVASAFGAALLALEASRSDATRDWVNALRKEQRESILRDIERVTRDPAFTALRRAPRLEREVPFLLPVGGDFLSGTIDVLVEGMDGALSIVDYKTDRTVPTHGVGALPRRYREQALLSALALTSITKRPLREFRFLFVAADPIVVVSLEIDEDLLAEARSLVARLRRDVGNGSPPAAG